MEPITTSTVSPAVLVGTGIVIGVAGTLVVVHYKEEIRAGGRKISAGAKGLFGKKQPALVAPVAVAPTPVAPVAVAPTPVAPVAVVEVAPVAVAPTPVAPVAVVEVAPTPVAEETPTVAEIIEAMPAEAVTALLNEVMVQQTSEQIQEAQTTAILELAGRIGAELAAQEKGVAAPEMLVTAEIASEVAKAMTALPTQPNKQQQSNRQHKPHQRR